jgi:hypothetical protein
MKIKGIVSLLRSLKGESRQQLREEIIEAILLDISDQLGVIDPVNDADEMIDNILDNNNQPLSFLAFLLGVEDLDDYAVKLYAEYANDDD